MFQSKLCNTLIFIFIHLKEKREKESSLTLNNKANLVL